VFFRKKAKHERFYLLPGQGGKNYYRKQRYFILWSAAVALVFGAGLTLVMWWLAKPKH
jgi:hypothetical protein